MFDIGWSELLVVAVVMIIVVGPKDLPGMLRAFGRTMSQVRRTANDFKRQFNDALREAENESGLKETSEDLKSMGSIGSINPMAEITKGLDDLKRDVTSDGQGSGALSAAGTEEPRAAEATNNPGSAVRDEKPPSTPAKKKQVPAKSKRRQSAAKPDGGTSDILKKSGSDAA